MEDGFRTVKPEDIQAFLGDPRPENTAVYQCEMLENGECPFRPYSPHCGKCEHFLHDLEVFTGMWPADTLVNCSLFSHGDFIPGGMGCAYPDNGAQLVQLTGYCERDYPLTLRRTQLPE
ncbi:hypothetical protein GF362_06195 [Candidatus Dojkabacteria bacterium]|nr:hypothetical protein [Candidatus Dojkabacteria bacterium]